MPGRVGRASGFPPLAVGVGIGEGEWAGELMRGFCDCGLRFCWGTAGEGAGEPASEPKVRLDGARLLATGPPLGMKPLVPAALMVTDDLRL